LRARDRFFVGRQRARRGAAESEQRKDKRNETVNQGTHWQLYSKLPATRERDGAELKKSESGIADS
jgi:hypothetical protein